MTTTTLNPLSRFTSSTTSLTPRPPSSSLVTLVKADISATGEQLASAKAELEQHRSVMSRALYTPQGYERAQRKAEALEGRVAELESRLRVLNAELAGHAGGLTAQDVPQLKAEQAQLLERAEQIRSDVARAVMTPAMLAKATEAIEALEARGQLVGRFLSAAAPATSGFSGASSFE